MEKFSFEDQNDDTIHDFPFYTVSVHLLSAFTFSLLKENVIQFVLQKWDNSTEQVRQLKGSIASCLLRYVVLTCSLWICLQYWCLVMVFLELFPVFKMGEWSSSGWNTLYNTSTRRLWGGQIYSRLAHTGRRPAAAAHPWPARRRTV